MHKRLLIIILLLFFPLENSYCKDSYCRRLVKYLGSRLRRDYDYPALKNKKTFRLWERSYRKIRTFKFDDGSVTGGRPNNNVFEVEDSRTAARYVLKLSLNKEHLRHEVEIMKKLKLPLLIKTAESGDYYAILMTKIDGVMLSKLEFKRPEDAELLMEITKEIIRKVEHMHNNNIIYADLKAGQVIVELFTEEGTGKRRLKNLEIIDYEAAYELQPGVNHIFGRKLDTSEKIIGSPSNFPPEFLTMDYEGGYPRDWYAVGMILKNETVGLDGDMETIKYTHPEIYELYHLLTEKDPRIRMVNYLEWKHSHL
jgi:serine/threonine protein kinase